MLTIISVLSRKEAIKKGDLVDVSSIAKEIGFEYRIDLTHSVFEKIIGSSKVGYSLEREKKFLIQNVLQMFDHEFKKAKDNTFLFPVISFISGKACIITLKAVINKNYKSKTDITIMQRDEFIKNNRTGVLKGRLKAKKLFA